MWQRPRVHHRLALRELATILPYICGLLEFRSARSSICFSFTSSRAAALEGSVDCRVRAASHQKSTSVCWTDGIINRGELKKTFKEIQGQDEGTDYTLDRGVHCTRSPPTSLAPQADSLFLRENSCLSVSMATWQLSKAFYQMTLGP